MPSHLDAIRRGDWMRAIDELRLALEEAPTAPDLHALLGVAFLHTGNPQHARHHFHEALRVDPDNIDAMVHLGILAYANREYDDAIRWTRSALMRRPEHSVALLHLARALSEKGFVRDAVVVWNRLTRLTPQSPDAWVGLGIGLGMLGESETAADCFQRALIAAPNHHEASVRLGTLYVERGALAEARALLERCAEDPFAQISLAQIDLRRGAYSSAETRLAPFLELRSPPVPAVEAWARLRLRQERGEEALPALDAALSRALPDFERVLLLHARGDIRDALGGTAAAFADWTAANRLRGVAFDEQRNATQTDAVIHGYRSLNLLRGHTDGSAAVFIVGMPRSGTSLLEQMLDNHPTIRGAGERKALHRAAQRLPGYPQTADRFAEETLNLAGEAYLSSIASFIGPQTRLVIDKMPHNFRNLGLIWQILPGARVIHCRRDPVDVCFSCYRQRFSEGMAYTTDLRALAAFYKDYERLMAHWRRVLPAEMFLEIRYEDLVRQPEPTLRTVFSFLEIPWDPVVLRPEENPRDIATASYAQVKRPIYTSSIGRARRYAEHLRPLERWLYDTPRNMQRSVG